jgi:hypothetical protein
LIKSFPCIATKGIDALMASWADPSTSINVDVIAVNESDASLGYASAHD